MLRLRRLAASIVAGIAITGMAITGMTVARVGLQEPRLNLFVAGDNEDCTVAGRLFTAHRWPLAVGSLKLVGGFSYAKTDIDSVKPTPAQLLALGLNDVLFGVEERNTLTDAAPRSKGVFTANWSSEHWSLLGRVTRYGSAVRVFNFGGGFEPRQEYSAKTQLDLEAEFKYSAKLSVAFGGTNVLDEYPDRSSDDINFAGNFPYDVLSPIGFNGAFYYARLRIGF